MNRHLDKYLAYAKELRKERRQCTSLGVFSQRVKCSPKLRLLRREARIELQAIYGLIKNHFQLPYIDVYLPARKKPHIIGLAFYSDGIPEQIRVYHITGCATKSYDLWLPTDLSVATEERVFETFIHESAHVLDVYRNGDTAHEEPFVEAYEDIETCLKACGYANLINPDLRLSGVPPESYANKMRLGSYIVPKRYGDYSFSF
jgi:hypothetical protein